MLTPITKSLEPKFNLKSSKYDLVDNSSFSSLVYSLKYSSVAWVVKSLISVLSLDISSIKKVTGSLLSEYISSKKL